MLFLSEDFFYDVHELVSVLLEVCDDHIWWGVGVVCRWCAKLEMKCEELGFFLLGRAREFGVVHFGRAQLVRGVER